MNEEFTNKTELNDDEQNTAIEAVIERPNTQSSVKSEPLQSNEDDAPTPQEARKKRRLKIAFTVLFILAMVAVIVYTAVNDFSGENVSLARVAEMIGENWYYILVLFGLFALTIFSETLKVFIMLRKTTGRYMFGTAFKCATLGKFYDYVTPFGSGGQPFQIYYLSKSGVPSGPAGAIPIGSMFLLTFSFFVCSIVSFIVGVSTEMVPIYIQILAYFGAVLHVSISLFLVVFSFFPKAGHKVIAWGVKVCTKLRICKKPEQWIAKGNRAIDNNKTNMGILLQSKLVLIVGFLLSLIFTIAQCSMPYFAMLLFSDALKEVGLTPSWELWFEITRVTFFIYCAITIVPTPGNSGAADGTFYGLFVSILAVAGTCFTAMMIWRMFSFYSYIVLGAFVSIVIRIVNQIRAKRAKRLNLD